MEWEGDLERANIYDDETGEGEGEGLSLLGHPPLATPSDFIPNHPNVKSAAAAAAAAASAFGKLGRIVRNSASKRKSRSGS